MRSFARGLAGALLLLSALTAAHAIGQGRLLGTVADPSGAPIAGAKVVITSPDMATYKLERTSDSRGQFTAIILDAQRQYRIHVEKQGYVTLEEPLKLKIEDSVKETFTLEPQVSATLQRGGAAGGAGAAGTPPAAGAAGAGGGAPGTAAPPAGGAAAGPPPANAAEAKARHDAVAAYNDGVAALKTKDLPGATAKFEQAVAADPKLAAGHEVLASLYLELHKPADALAAADHALALEPGKQKVMLDRYLALKAMGDKPRAAQAIEELARSHPGPDVAREVAVSLYNDAADALRGKQEEQAVGELKRALEVDHTLEPAYNALGNIYLGKKDYRAALDVADRWVAVAPQSLSAQQLRYKVLTALKDPRAAEAKKAMESAKGEAGNPLNQGIELYNGNRIPEATKIFEQLIQAEPGNGRAHYMLGLCYVNSGNLAQAKEQLETFLKLAPPGDPEAKSAQEMLAEMK
jgi:tetratricopeptide (TPR) repeat protein